MNEKLCPKCGKIGTYHLMMRECDNCINEISRISREKPEPYIMRNGLLVPNKDATSG